MYDPVTNWQEQQDDWNKAIAVVKNKQR